MYLVHNRLRAIINVTGIINGTDFDSLTGGLVRNLPREKLTLVLTGLFKAPADGMYTFYTESDDASYLWLDHDQPNRFEFVEVWSQPWTWRVNDAKVKNSGWHGIQTRGSLPIALHKNQYYPIRIVYGQDRSDMGMRVWFDGPTGAGIKHFSGLWFTKA